MKFSILWLSKNLRLHDNITLVRAAENADRLVVVYCLTDWDYRSAPFRSGFLKESLLDLDKNLRRLGQILLVSEVSPENTLQLILKDLGKEASIHVYFEAPCNQKDSDFFLKMERSFAQCHWIPAGEPTLMSFSDLPESARTPEAFTPFRHQVEKNWKVAPDVDTPESLPPPVRELEKSFSSSNTRPVTFPQLNFRGGETHGLKRLQHYLWKTHRISSYKETRNGMIEFDDSSKFSPWLSLGCLSPRRIYHEIKKYETAILANESTNWLVFELIWRDFFKFYARHHGNALFQLHGPRNQWPNLESENLQLVNFQKWCEGMTDSEFINANMRELRTTGWMSNRGRQNAASYLCKTLDVNWLWGADWFARHLLDLDVESNWGNWAYLAGTGADPRDRKFDVERQAEIYDPQNAYIKRFSK